MNPTVYAVRNEKGQWLYIMPSGEYSWREFVGTFHTDLAVALRTLELLGEGSVVYLHEDLPGKEMK